MKILVLALNQYGFTDEKTGEVKEGATIEYLTTDFTNTSSDFGTKKGYFSLKQSLDKEIAKQITNVPGVYEVELSMRSGSDRKAQLVMNSFKLTKEFELEF